MRGTREAVRVGERVQLTPLRQQRLIRVGQIEIVRHVIFDNSV